MSAEQLTVGQGVTETLWTDSIGYVVVEATAKRAKVARLDDINASTGHKPARYVNGFPVWQHTYTTDELASRLAEGTGPYRTLSLRKDGRWYFAGSSTPAGVKYAVYYRDYSS